MHIRVEKGQEDIGTEQGQAQPLLQSPSPALPVSSPLQVFILCSLALVALIPRIILANQLDLITDEIIYILAGKSYIPLVKHITTSPWVCPGGGTDCWQTNYEHPPLVKFFIGFSILANNHAGHLFNELMAARMPSIIAGTVLIMAIYWLGRKPFGNIVALLAALSLACSPWLVYFSSIAYLDMTMTTFITIAYLLTWHATRRPWLYSCVALFVGLGIDSKYTAALIIPGILLFTAYFFVLRPGLPASHRSPALPWRWWLMASILTPLYFFVLDPAIWSDPLHRFVHSVLYEWNHSVGGHLTYLAGSYNLHVPHWAALYIIINKISAFITVPAAIFGIIALVQLIRFHLSIGKGPISTSLRARFAMWLRGDRKGQYRSNNELDRGETSPTGSAQGPLPTSSPPPTPTRPLHSGGLLSQDGVCRRGRGCGEGWRGPCADPSSPSTPYLSGIDRKGREGTSPSSTPRRVDVPRAKEATTIAFLFIWLLTTLTMFSLLNIVVGTHYLLPLAPPIAIAGAYTLVYCARYSIRKMGISQSKAGEATSDGVGAVGNLSPQTGSAQGPLPTQPLPRSLPDPRTFWFLYPRIIARPEGDPSVGIGGEDGSGRGPCADPVREFKFMPIGLTPFLLKFALFLIIGIMLVGPHLLGLLNTAQAEGYTSEFFHGENRTLQVAYPGYREAVQWLDTHTQGDQRIGLVALPETLWRGDPTVSWFVYNSNLPKRFQIQEAHPQDPAYPYNYVVWPMHLVQRGYLLPPSWHVIHQITGGDTTYCYIAVAP